MVKKSIPPRTQWAIDRLIKVARTEHLTSVQFGFTDCDGELVGHASIQDKDGNWAFYWCDDGQWYEHVEVDA